LAKSNLAEFATSPYETVGSRLPGYTRNPYALDRVPAGSSGGTAAAVAASFGAVGLGTDTGNSIRGPSSHTSLVGIRSTMGLTSRDGIVPRQLHRDIGGPIARSVADAVAVFDVIAGSDPADPVTSAAQGRRPVSYLASLDKNGLMGARVGVLRQLLTGPYPEPDADPEIVKLFEAALADMKKQGAEIVEEIRVAEIDEIPASALGGCNRFKHDLKAYLAHLGPDAPALGSPARDQPEEASGRHQQRRPARRRLQQSHSQTSSRGGGEAKGRTRHCRQGLSKFIRPVPALCAAFHLCNAAGLSNSAKERRRHHHHLQPG
jgi:Asp-tRNA(Asn)/Glu-tRNA(Gln) amidotransferase A subunit family amidase